MWSSVTGSYGQWQAKEPSEPEVDTSPSLRFCLQVRACKVIRAWGVLMQLVGQNGTLSPVVYADIGLSRNTQ